jgi:hypothetical protein
MSLYSPARPNNALFRQTPNQGVLAGVLGCVLGVLGIFTWGIIFVPLAAICSLVGLIRGAGGLSIAGIGCSLLGGVLTVWGFVVSPSLWILLGAGILAIHQPVLPQVPTSATPQAIQQGGFAAPPSSSPDALKREAAAQAVAAMMECKSKRLSSELTTYMASVQCSNPRIIEAFQKADYRYMDFIYSFTAKRLELARGLDRGQITEAQSDYEYSRFVAEMNNKERQRDLEPIPCSGNCDRNSGDVSLVIPRH